MLAAQWHYSDIWEQWQWRQAGILFAVEVAAREWNIVAPCHTPQEVSAQVEAERREEREACARHLENWPVDDERMIADECAAAIRAGGGA